MTLCLNKLKYKYYIMFELKKCYFVSIFWAKKYWTKKIVKISNLWDYKFLWSYMTGVSKKIAPSKIEWLIKNSSLFWQTYIKRNYFKLTLLKTNTICNCGMAQAETKINLVWEWGRHFVKERESKLGTENMIYCRFCSFKQWPQRVCCVFTIFKFQTPPLHFIILQTLTLHFIICTHYTEDSLAI